MFFFFKHKTAYEMRISDGSADVCSSDLVGRHQPLGDAGERAAFQLVALDRAAVGATALAAMAGAAVAVVDDDGVGTAAHAAFEQAREEIGGTPLAMQRPPLCRFLDRGVPSAHIVQLALARFPQPILPYTNARPS